MPGAQGISVLDAVIATHPHEDHIGGLNTIIKGLTVQSVYLPNATTTTVAFKDFIDAVNASGATRIQAQSGVTLDVAGLSGTFLAPAGNQYTDLNHYSAVLRLTYGDTSFLFTGDAESISENEMLKAGNNLSADVLKIGHHGSDSSTTADFLKAVSPSIAVISVGQGNSYGHPAQNTLDKLAASGVTVYRTDEAGTVVIQSDGKSITVNGVAVSVQPNAPPVDPETEKPSTSTTVQNNTASPATSTAPTVPVVQQPKSPVIVQPESPAVVQPAPDGSGDTIVYITKTGEKYHRDGCRSLAKSKIEITLGHAKQRGYTPCSICKPPQ
jgi:beta-lactamase superfamily II metal-dependent hydrolase